MADDSEQIGQDEIEELLRKAQDGEAPAPPPPSEEAPAETVGQDDIEAMLGGAVTKTAEDAPLGQGDVEALLARDPAAQPPPPAAADGTMPDGGMPDDTTPGDIDLLLQRAEEAIASVNDPELSEPDGVVAFQLADFTGSPPSSDKATLDLIRDVELDLKIELGRTHMYLEDVLQLRKGAVVPLDKMAGDPVDIFVNGRLVARGEVLVLNDNFCVRVAELITGNAAG